MLLQKAGGLGMTGVLRITSRQPKSHTVHKRPPKHSLMEMFPKKAVLRRGYVPDRSLTFFFGD